MKRLLTVFVAVILAVELVPSAALAQRARGGFHSGRADGSPRTGSGFGHAGFGRKGFVHKGFGHTRFFPERSVLPQPPVDPWRFWPPSSTPKHRLHRGSVVPFAGFVPAPSIVVAPPVVSADASGGGATIVFAPAPASSPAPVSAAVSGPTALPTPTLVDFPTGWYQLRGDGVTTPYTWVWIPKPPAEPASVAGISPPASGPTGAAPPAPQDSREERGVAYHWTDSGVTTWTNRLDRVPKRFRDEAASAEPN